MRRRLIVTSALISGIAAIQEGVRVKPSLRPERHIQGCILGPKPPIRSTLMRTITRFSPG